MQHNDEALSQKTKLKQQKPQQQQNKKKDALQATPLHDGPLCCDATDPQQCNVALGKPIILQNNMLYRLFYTNPVCLLTSVNTRLSNTNTGNGAGGGNGGENSLPPSSASSSPSSYRPNVMAITWLTPTDNHGGIFLSMNADRFTLQNVLQTKRFVLNVPIAGMEELIKRIGKCSGRDGMGDGGTGADVNDEEKKRSNNEGNKTKFEHLGIEGQMSGFGFQKNPYVVAALTTEKEKEKNANASETTTTTDDDATSIDSIVTRHIENALQRHYGGTKGTSVDDLSAEAKEALTAAIKNSLAWGDVVLSNCVAHVVCEVVGLIPPIPSSPSSSETSAAIPCSQQDGPIILPSPASSPQPIGRVGTEGHVSIFAQMKIGAVRSNYWTQSLFKPKDDKTVAPYLTFLGQGGFLHATLPQTTKGTE